jgi:ActR/RegA family two-component response regulator
MRKIIVTGYPSLENAVAAVNKDADGYMIKPILDMNVLLKAIKEQLKKQEEARQYSEKKVTEYVESRIRDEETKQNQGYAANRCSANQGAQDASSRSANL